MKTKPNKFFDMSGRGTPQAQLSAGGRWDGNWKEVEIDYYTINCHFICEFHPWYELAPHFSYEGEVGVVITEASPGRWVVTYIYLHGVHVDLVAMQAAIVAVIWALGIWFSFKEIVAPGASCDLK